MPVRMPLSRVSRSALLILKNLSDMDKFSQILLTPLLFEPVDGNGGFSLGELAEISRNDRDALANKLIALGPSGDNTPSAINLLASA